MIEKLSNQLGTTRLEADICIIGGGAAGIALAHTLRGSGISILLAESGAEVRRPEADDLNQVSVTGHPFPGASDGRARRLGGATTLWAGQSLPLYPIDFQPRPWVPYSGWPVSHSELNPYWARAECFLGLDGMRYDDVAWEHLRSMPPAFDPGALLAQVSWLPNHRNFAHLYRADLQRAKSVRVLLDATATSITPPAGDQSRYSVRLASLMGHSAHVAAPVVVVCCGGLDTPRLLLASKEAIPAGLGNQRGLVGRFLQDHPTATCAEVLEPDFGRLVQHFRPFYRREGRLFPKIALADRAQANEQVMNATSELIFTAPAGSSFTRAKEFFHALRSRRMAAAACGGARLALHGGELVRHGWTRFVQQRLPAARGARITIWAHIEQAPDPDSRLTLDHNCDALGMPRAKIHWRLNDLDRRTFKGFTKTVGAEFKRLGLGRVVSAPWLEHNAWRDHVQDFYHHIGTTRMAEDPACGVVDRDLQVFGHPGLYVASSSVFPTGGASNPTLTILALTLRLADRLRLRNAAGSPT